MMQSCCTAAVVASITAEAQSATCWVERSSYLQKWLLLAEMLMLATCLSAAVECHRAYGNSWQLLLA
jgi:hypothetical protein